MQRNSSTHIMFLLVFYSILNIIIEFGLCYYFDSMVIILSLSILFVLFGSHNLLKRTKNYEVNFTYTLLLVFLSTVITILLNLNKESSFIPVNVTLYLIVAINWIIPCAYSIVRCLFDHRNRLSSFNAYYRNTNIIFGLVYTGAMAYLYFIKYMGPLATNSLWSYNFIPFMSIATYIEQFIYQQRPLFDLLIYVLIHLGLWIPFGFYVALFLRRQGRLLKLLPLLIVPLLIEGTQYLLRVETTDIDNLLLAIIGGLLGQAIFYFINYIFLVVKDEEFLEESRTVLYSTRNTYY